MPGARIEEGARVQYAIVSENSRIGANAVVGERPEEMENKDDWGVAVIGPGCTIPPGTVVEPKAMIDAEEVKMMMMRGNNVMGILFAYVHEERVRELTQNRVMASVPFGGRYRLVDFPLSNMVNSGINKVGVITEQNYQSLMDHLGSGKAWDLSRKREGLYLLPPLGRDHPYGRKD